MSVAHAEPAADHVIPAPTRDLDQGLRNIAEHGFTIVPDALSGDVLKLTRDALYRAAESDRRRGRDVNFNDGPFYIHGANQRVWNVLSRDPCFEDLVEHPLGLAYVKAVLGWPALLGNISANITGPGGEGMLLHADQGFMPEPWSDQPQGVNLAWCIDDFTEENGATNFVLGSHKLNRAPRPEDMDAPSVAIEAPAGSLVIFEARVWHKTGANRSKDQTRAGIFGWYTKPIYRPQENWFLSLKPEIHQFASEDMKVLLGYTGFGLGLKNGVAPG